MIWKSHLSIAGFPLFFIYQIPDLFQTVSRLKSLIFQTIFIGIFTLAATQKVAGWQKKI